MLNLSTQTDEASGVSIVKVQGRVDSDTAPQLEDGLQALLKENCSKIVVNLEDVDFLSSAGLRALVRAYQVAQKAGGSVRLAAASESIQGILLTVGLLQMLRVYPTDQDAVATF